VKIKAIAIAISILCAISVTACGAKQVSLDHTYLLSKGVSGVKGKVATASATAKATKSSSKYADNRKPGKNSTKSAKGISPEFKEAMDSYEKFFYEYVIFMKKYSKSNDPMSMLDDYMKYMKQYQETMKKMEKIEEKDLSTEEYFYFMEVMNRINKKLLEATQ